MMVPTPESYGKETVHCKLSNMTEPDFLWPHHQLPDKRDSTAFVIFPEWERSKGKAEPRDSLW